MGDTNQFSWVKENRELIGGPVLEVGSRHYDPATAVDYRALCPGLVYVGVDMNEGKNVDLVLDFTSDITAIRTKLGGVNFRTVICCSVLEHVQDVFTMARNLSAVVAQGGTLFISVPFTWRFHGYPDDYWRFTPSALKYLFPEFRFLNERCTISSNVANDVTRLTDDVNSFIVRPRSVFEPRYRLLSRFRWFAWLRMRSDYDRYAYFLLPSNINMVGVKASGEPARPV